LSKRPHFLFIGVSLPEMNVSPDISGDWIGHYVGHFDEMVRIDRLGPTYVAVKMSGDDHVPAGEITWRVDATSLLGEGQIAEQEFRNPRFVSGELEVIDPDHIVFHWLGVGHVEYRRDD